MSDAIPRAAGSAPKKWQYRFGMWFLLMTVLFTALVLGWVMREHRRAERRTALVRGAAAAATAAVRIRPRLCIPSRKPLFFLYLAGRTRLKRESCDDTVPSAVAFRESGSRCCASEQTASLHFAVDGR
jgi:hypothetical protein